MFCHPPSPTKTISWTHGGNSQLESFLNLPIFQFISFFGPTKQYVQRWKKVDTWNRCCEFTPLDPTKQYVHCMRKVTTWCHFENLPPPRTFKTIRLIQHMKKVDMLSHCYRFIFRPPTKHFVRHMNRLGILNHVWNVFTFPYNKARRWTNKIGTSSHVWNLRPLDHTQQYIQHMDQDDMLMHSFGFTCPVPYETLCLVYETAWHLYLCQKMFLAFPCIKTIRWTHGKKGILSHFWNLQSLDPTKQYEKKRWKLTHRVLFTVKVDTLSFS